MNWEPIATFGLAGGLLGMLVAAAVFTTRPDRRQNRALAGFLGLAGLAVLARAGLMPLLQSPAAVFAGACVYYVSYLGAHLFHLLFLSTLDTPWVRLLRRVWVRRALVGVFAGLAAIVVLVPEVLWQGVAAVPRYLQWVPVPVAWHNAYNLVFAALWAYGLLAVVSAARLADREARPAQAVRTGLVVHNGGLVLYLLWDLFGNAGLSAQGLLVKALVPPAFLTAWLAGWAGYGIVRAQVFDADLRLKRGMAATISAAMILGAVLGGHALLGQAFSVGGLMAFALPLVPVAFAAPWLVASGRWAADRLMPDVMDTPEYRLARKKEIYVLALEAATRDGQVRERDRSRLVRLQRRLSLPRAEAHRLEKMAREGVAVRGA